MVSGKYSGLGREVYLYVMENPPDQMKIGARLCFYCCNWRFVIGFLFDGGHLIYFVCT